MAPWGDTSLTPLLDSTALGTHKNSLVFLVFVSFPQSRAMSSWGSGCACLSPSFLPHSLYRRWPHQGAPGRERCLPPTLEHLGLTDCQIPGLVDVAEKLVVVRLWVRVGLVHHCPQDLSPPHPCLQVQGLQTPRPTLN